MLTMCPSAFAVIGLRAPNGKAQYGVAIPVHVCSPRVRDHPNVPPAEEGDAALACVMMMMMGRASMLC